jgi:CheY-like chemotaxis protein/two-component sensor histidine kinase
LERINLSGFIENITRLLSTIISKKASLRLQLKAGLPLIEGDAAQGRQVVINLLTNASDALGDREGAITVSTGVRSFEADELRPSSPGGPLPAGEYVFLQVADTGCGMDDVTMGRIFDPFFTTKFTGRGLGLAAVHGIVRGHKGALQVESAPGSGATFRVFFPALDESASSAEDKREIVAEPKARLSGRILVVDDEPAVRQLAGKILEDAGLEVATAVDGYDAVRQFEARPTEIDLVILDLTMPGLDGAEVFERLTRTKPDVKVILCSGYSLTDLVPALGGRRPHATLRKPYTPAELINSVSAVL